MQIWHTTRSSHIHVILSVNVDIFSMLAIPSYFESKIQYFQRTKTYPLEIRPPKRTYTYTAVEEVISSVWSGQAKGLAGNLS